MRKSILFLLLITVLVAGLLPVGVSAANSPRYILSGKTVEAGEVFTMDVAIADNPGIISLRFKIVYDTSVLQLQSVSNKGLLNGYTTPSPTITSPYTLRWADSLANTDNAAQGTVVTLTFKALKAATTCSVSIEHNEARNASGKKVSFAGASATVTVACQHNYGSWTKVNDTTHKCTCSVCQKEETASHTWNSGKVTKAATCKETGVKTYTCTTCNATKTETIAKTSSHSYGSWTKVNDTTHKHTCSVCQKEETASHTWNSGKVTKAATCKEAGVKTYTCTTCKATKTETVAKLTTHTYKNDCDTDCNICGATRTVTHNYKTSWNKDKSGHWHECSVCKHKKDFEAHKPGAAATETKAQKCTVCSYVIKAATGHTHKYDTKWTTDGESHWYACSGCDEKKDFAEHSFDNACDADCNECGYTRTTTHTYKTEWSFDGDRHWHECDACGEKADEATHTPSAEATATTAQTCTECGYELAPATGTAPTEPLKPNGDNNSNGNTTLIVVACIVGVAAIGGGVAVFLIKKKR